MTVARVAINRRHTVYPGRLALRDLTIYPLDPEVLKSMRATQHKSEKADHKIVWP